MASHSGARRATSIKQQQYANIHHENSKTYKAHADLKATIEQQRDEATRLLLRERENREAAENAFNGRYLEVDRDSARFGLETVQKCVEFAKKVLAKVWREREVAEQMVSAKMDLETAKGATCGYGEVVRTHKVLVDKVVRIITANNAHGKLCDVGTLHVEARAKWSNFP